MRRWLLLMILIFPLAAHADTRVALHATTEEIAIWNQRKTIGPFVSEYNTILSRANSFRASPISAWPGNTQNAAWDGDNVRDCVVLPTVYPGGSSSDCPGDNGRQHADGLRDAGFIYLLTGDTSYFNPVRTFLLAQANTTTLPGANFANTTRWPLTYVNQDKDFHISIYIRKLVYAYSYIRPGLSGADQTTLDTWFNNAATWLDRMVHNAAVTRYPNRLSDNYSTVGSCQSSPPSPGAQFTHNTGSANVNQRWTFGFAWDNKQSNHNAAVAAVGVVTGDATLKASAKRFVKEWIRANIYPDGSIWDQARWGGATPQSGWNYALTTLGSNITAADHIARTGDTELYTYSTSAGDCGSDGGSKSILSAATRYANLALANVFAYASTTNTSDPALRIDPDGTGGRCVNQVSLAQGNRFWQNGTVESGYGVIPTSPNCPGGVDFWGGDWGNMPSMRFMFAGLEGASDPYLTVALSKINTLIEKFTTPINTALWTVHTGANYTVGMVSGQLQIANSVSVNDYGALVSVDSFDATNVCLTAEVPLVGNAASSAAATTWLKYYPAGGSSNAGVEIGVSNGQLSAKAVGAVVGTPLTYNATTMRWWRLCEVSGVTTWEYTSAPTAGWNTLRSQATPAVATSVSVEVGAGAFPGVSGTVRMDNINSPQGSPCPG
jgi:hypothetical protein